MIRRQSRFSNDSFLKQLSINLFVVVCLIPIGCRNEDSSLKSPDGSYEANITVNKNKSDKLGFTRLVIEIRDSSGNLSLKEQTRASNRMKWAVAWDAQNRFWLKSADIGTYYWEFDTDEMIWKEHQCKAGSPPMPTSLEY